MKRWHWRSLALLGVILAVALIAVPRFTWGTTQHVAAQTPPSVQIDMDVTNGTGPCDINHIDHTRTTAVGQTYTVAVCLVDADAASPPVSFSFNIAYQDNLNECQGSPIMNVAATDIPGSAPFSSPGLGSGWLCTSNGTTPPRCDLNSPPGTGPGIASFACFTLSPPSTLPVGEGVAAPIAEVEFTAIGIGTDNLLWQNAQVTGPGFNPLINCANLGDDNPENRSVEQCVTGEDVKIPGAPTATPPPAATFTPTIAPTVTPACGLEGLPTCTPTPRAHTSTPTVTATATAPATGGAAPTSPPPPPPSSGAGGAVRPPNTGDGSNSASLNLTIAWIIAGAMLVTLAGGAFYLRRLRTRQ